MPSDNSMLVARIRKNDDTLREYFKKVKANDRPYEIRRLLEKAIKIEAEEQAYIEELKNEKANQD